MWMVTLTTHWGCPPYHYVYSELLCEEWLSRLGSVLTAVLCEASEVVPKPPSPCRLCSKYAHLNPQSSVFSAANVDSYCPKVLDLWRSANLSAGWLFSLTNVEIGVVPTALDCVDHVVQFVPWCFFLRVHQLLPEGVTRSDINWDV